MQNAHQTSLAGAFILALSHSYEVTCSRRIEAVRDNIK